MNRVVVALILTGLLAGCGSDGRQAPVAPAPPPPPPPPISIAPPPISLPPPGPPDMCGAWELQGLVGRPRTEIPVPLQPARRRVVCTTCPKTMDYSPARMTIEYDAATNMVTKIGCN